MCDVFSSVMDATLIERQRVKRACQVLDSDVETAAVSRKAAQHSTVALANSNHAVTGSDPRVGIQQRVSNFVHGQRQRDIREVRSEIRRTLTLREMARHALPLPHKKLAAGNCMRRHTRQIQIFGGVLLILVGTALVTGVWADFVSWVRDAFVSDVTLPI